MPAPGDAARHVLVSGRVQGVGFRAFVQRRAVELGLGGWVRNLRDGEVEAVFCGPDERVARMIEHCREGPAHAHVTRADVRDASDDELLRTRAGERFSVLSTA